MEVIEQKVGKEIPIKAMVGNLSLSNQLLDSNSSQTWKETHPGILEAWIYTQTA